jgi:Family of unknown function (DUF5681)
MIDNSKAIQPRRHGFQKGVSGNPKGKPKGAINHHARLVARLATENVAEVVAAIVEKARGGDTCAAELVLRYAAPLPRSRMVRFPLPPLNSL